MSDITLSKGVRQNLLSLQGTAELLSRTQDRLSTGKKVNSALDNPINFFTSSGLQSRANDLSRLLDSVSNAVQTLQSADKGISAITKLIESAGATARQVLTTAEGVTTYNLTQTGNVAITDDTAATTAGTGAALAPDDEALITGNAGGLAGGDLLNALGFANGDTITISDGTNTVVHTIVDNTTEDLDAVLATLNGGAATWTASIVGGDIEVLSDNAVDTITISSNNAVAFGNIGFTAGTNDVANPTNTDLTALAGETLTVSVGATDATVTFGSDFGAGEIANRAQLLTALNAQLGASGTASYNADVLEVVATANTDSIAIEGSDPAVLTAFGFNVTNEFDPTNAQLAGFTGQFTLQVGSEAAQTIEFGNGNAGEIVTRAGLEARIAEINLNLTDVALSIDVNDFLNVTSTSAENITIGGTTPTSFGITAQTYAPTATFTANATRTSLQEDFNRILQQITDLAGDASYNGINLLADDDLTVTFNEDGSSTLQIAGVDFSATGLGLTAVNGAGFQDTANVTASIAQLDTATATLRAQASKFGSNLSIVQTRQDFTKNMISVLQIGADNLVLADTNEEGANMLALNTRQQLATTALSLAAQADQNVLRLF